MKGSSIAFDGEVVALSQMGVGALNAGSEGSQSNV